jgi:ABC-type uncharacterized transport system permease subunit
LHPSSARTDPAPASTLWAGRIMTGLAVVFLLFDSAMKVMRLAPALEGTAQLGYPTSLVFGIGCLQLACVVLYAIPLTSVLGAILLTGYLGGAVATHVRVGSPLFTHVLFPVYLGVLIWGGLFFLEDRLRALIPLRNPKP